MFNAVGSNHEDYNQVTYEILDLIKNLREKTKESMMIGEHFILKGIDIFEASVKAINPVELNEEAIYLIGRCVNIALFKEQEQKGHVNANINYGINTCYMMLDLYDKSKKRKLIKQ